MPPPPTGRKISLWEWARTLQAITPTRRRRRIRRHPVPFLEWLGTFAVLNRIVAEAYFRAAEKYMAEGGEIPEAFGAVLRIALNAYLLPELRRYLAEHPGIESPEEVTRVIQEKLDEILRNYEKFKEKLTEVAGRLGMPKDLVEKYIEAARAVIEKMKEVIPEVVREMMELVSKVTAKSATARA